MKRLLTQHRYALIIAIRRLISHPFSTLANLFVISLSLALPLLAAGILISVQPVLRQVPVNPELTLFIKPETSEQQIQNLAKGLGSDYQDHVAQVRIISKDQAKESLQTSSAWAQALEALPGNPLPDAIVVTLNDQVDIAQHAQKLADQWQDIEWVDHVQLDSDWVRRLDALLGFLRLGTAFLAASVVLVVIATVFNTVRMQALTQREEIAVARLVGATEPFVRRPFLYLGALTGLLSGFAAILISSLALKPLNAALGKLAQTYNASLLLRLPSFYNLVLALVVIALLAAIAARWSVTRNTRF